MSSGITEENLAEEEEVIETIKSQSSLVNNVNVNNTTTKSPEDTLNTREIIETNYSIISSTLNNNNNNDNNSKTNIEIDNYENFRDEDEEHKRILVNYDNNNRVETTSSRIIDVNNNNNNDNDESNIKVKLEQISENLKKDILVGVNIEEEANNRCTVKSEEYSHNKFETISNNLFANDDIIPIIMSKESLNSNLNNFNTNANANSSSYFMSSQTSSNNNNNNNTSNNNNCIENNQSTKTIKTETTTSSQFLNNNNISKSDKLHEIEYLSKNLLSNNNNINTSTASRVNTSTSAVFGTTGATTSAATSALTSTTAASSVFHPTWDEWKRTHLINNNSSSSSNTTTNIINNNNKLNELLSSSSSSLLTTKQQQDKLNNNETRDYNKIINSSNNNRNILLDNNELNENKIKTTRSIIEETYIQKSSHQNQQYQEQEQDLRRKKREEFEEREHLNQSDQINNSYYHNINNNNNYYYKQENLPNFTQSTNTKTTRETTTNKENMKSQHQHHQQNKLFEQSKKDVYNPPQPTPVAIHNNNVIEYSGRKDSTSSSSNNASTSAHRTNSTRTTKHYPVFPIDIYERREPSPVRLSSIVLAKEPPIEVKTQDERRVPPFVDSEPENPPALVAESPQPKKIKTIMTTQKRKDSAPNLTGWRTESDSDTEIQNRLLAKASGSIPIEYISIRRDPKPAEKKPDKGKKSITTGTNTSNDRGKRIAATNTNQDELPQYNLHVSLDSMYVKSRREASTSTERQNKNAATETDIKQRNAATETESEPEPPPPPPPPPKPDEYVYTTRKSRYTEWETASPPPPPPPPEVTTSSYRLEFLTKSPRVVHKRNVQTVQYQNQQFVNYPPVIQQQVRLDEDDRLIFGYREVQAPVVTQNYQHHEYSRRSGSFPSLFMRPMILQNTCSSRASNLINDCSSSSASTRRYIKQTSSTNYSPQITTTTTTFMPLTTGVTMTSNSGASSDVFNQQFSSMHAKFNDIFGLEQRVNVISEQPKTERFYKYSRTTTENQQALPQVVPTFGEIYHRYNARSNSTSGLQQHQQHQQFSNSSFGQTYRSPIVEMPLTPNSTMGKSSSNRERFFSSNENYSSNQNANQAGSYSASSFSQKIGGGGGPAITPINVNTSGGTSIHVNNESSSRSGFAAANAGSNLASSSSSSMMQRTSSFEPVIKQNNSTTSKTISSSTTTTTNSFGRTNNLDMENESNSFRKFSANSSQQGRGIRGGREEDEVEMINVRNEMDSEKQFKPINHQTVFSESSSSTPIAVNYSKSNGFASNSGAKRNFSSSSSYEHTSDTNGIANASNNKQQSYYSNSQIVN